MDRLLTVISTSSITILIICFLVFIFRIRILNYVHYYSKLQFDKKLEEFKSEELKRQKASLIADLLSEWISYPEDIKNLNKLTFEAFIWLPKETALKLGKLLSHKNPIEVTVRGMISEVREIIMGKDEAISSSVIVIFEEKDTKKPF